MTAHKTNLRSIATSLLLVGLWTAYITAGGAFAQQVSASPPVGTWVGNFSSKNFSSFPVTIAITQDANGTLHGAAVLNSKCISQGALVIRINGTNITLAGSDAKGDNVTFEGALVSSGTQMDLNYIINGSASGRCETDQGSGTLNKQ